MRGRRHCRLKGYPSMYNIYTRYWITFFIPLVATIIPELSTAANFPSTKVAHYQLDMSENDPLCHLLLSYYNNHLNDSDNQENGYIEDRFKVDDNSKETKFLRNSSDPWQREYKSIDIYNDEDLRNVYIVDMGINIQFMTFGTSLIIMKNQQKYSENLSPKSPTIDAWINFPEGNLTENSINYPLLKYPHYKEIKATWDAMDFASRVKNLGLAPPDLDYEAVGQRLIKFKNRIYVVARERSDGALKKAIGFWIVAYQLRPPGQLDDICYLQLRKN